MNKEEISKAALQYAQDKYCQEDNRTPQYMIAQIHAGRDGFKAGAEWRINSVWHEIKDELPQIGRLVVNEEWFDFIAEDEKDLNRIIKKYHFKKWAYVIDLIP